MCVRAGLYESGNHFKVERNGGFEDQKTEENFGRNPTYIEKEGRKNEKTQ